MARLLSEILLAPWAGPARLVGFVAKNINEQVRAEYLDEGKVQAELLDLTMRYDRGEVNHEEFEEQQARILQHLNDIRQYKEAEASAQSEAVEADQEYDEYGASDAGETSGE